MAKSLEGPAFYATGQRSPWRDMRAVLHPPYTAWHLSYVVLGAMIAPRVNWSTLIYTLLAFFLAVGIAAHALDELRGRPLGTALPSWLLSTAATLGLGGAVVFGAIGIGRVGYGLLAFIIVGAPSSSSPTTWNSSVVWCTPISASHLPGERFRC